MTNPIYLSNRLYMPTEYIGEYHKEPFRYTVSECKEDKDKDIIIENFIEFSNGYIGFNRGNIPKIITLLNNESFIDQRSKPAFKHDIKWDETKRLRTKKDDNSNQQEVADLWLSKYRYGQINAPCRWGKTVVLAYIICKLKVKTLVLAHQQELLTQFLKTFKDFTNVLDFQDSDDGPVVGNVVEWEDIECLDVAVMPYQRFVSGTKGDQWLIKLRDTFGAIVVDEVFKCAASCYNKVINNFNSYYRLGVSATPKRKDNLHCIVEGIIGPVVVKGETTQLTGIFKPMYTNYNPNTTKWVTLIKKLGREEARNDLIVKCVMEDLDHGHSIVIASWHRDHILWLTHLLQQEGIEAEAFHSKTKDRMGLINKARSGEIRVVISIRSMLLGIDVPRWSAFYCVTPINDPYVYYQEISRIRTPFFDKNGKSLKPTPLIRDFIDKNGMCMAMSNTRKRVVREQGFYTKKSETPDQQRKNKPIISCQNCIWKELCVDELKIDIQKKKKCRDWKLDIPNKNKLKKCINCKWLTRCINEKYINAKKQKICKEWEKK